MSNEGVALILRVVLVAFLIVVTAVVRTWIGPSKKRGLYMGLGMLAGMGAGVATASLMSRWLSTDVSVVLALFGIFVGWAVAGLYARRFPREAT